MFLVFERSDVNEPLEVRNGFGTHYLQVVVSMNFFCKDGSNIPVRSGNKVGCSGQLGENEVVQSGEQLVEGRRIFFRREERRFAQHVTVLPADSPAIDLACTNGKVRAFSNDK